MNGKGRVTLSPNHSMNAKGGGATISDSFGNLLFYTDGVSVWSRDHKRMVNGDGLNGNPATTQTVIIVPRPLHRYKYYIFTTSSRKDNTQNALSYSEVDMSLQGGLGEVISKNTLLLKNVSEKVAATFHGNNQDFWLLTHTWNSNTFLAYKVDSAGINTSGVETQIGSVYSGAISTGRGSFRLNTFFDANPVVVTLPDIGIFEMLRFDTVKGTFNSWANLSSMADRAAYAEFSTFTRFYTVSTKGDEIFEFDANGNDEHRTKASSRTIATGTGFGDLRLAADGYIYVASTTNANWLHTINYDLSFDQPTYYSKPGIFKANALSLGATNNLAGLPNTINNYAASWWGYGISRIACFGEPTTYRGFFPNSIDSMQWDFDDPASGASNFSKEISPTHVFKTPGKLFNISATFYARGTVEKGSLRYDTRYVFSLGADTALCESPKQQLILNPGLSSGVKSFKWQDGSTGPSFTVTKPGIYWLETTSQVGNCTFRDSIKVTAYPTPVVNLGNDTTMCTGKTLLLAARNPGAQYQWQDGSTNPVFEVSEPGIYHVSVTNNFGCTSADTIKVYYLTPPTINLGNDTTICEGTEILLDATLPGVTYKWQDGSTGSTLKVSKAGTYWVEGSIDVCSARDYITIRTRQGCLDNVFVPNIITPNADGLNDVFEVLDADKNNQWQIEIYNRFGRSVFKASNYQNNWDASGLSEGVYYYMLKDTANRILKGYVEVIR